MTRPASDAGGGTVGIAIAPEQQQLLRRMIDEYLKPFVQKIDSEAYYAETYLRALGAHGFFRSEGLAVQEAVTVGVYVVEETAKVCMTTAFNIWCHLAGLTYVRNSDNEYVRTVLLPQLEDGRLLAGTGLSNPMKFYAGLDRLYVRAVRDGDHIVLTGRLPMVSNLGEDHWFGVIAEVGEQERVMVFVPCSADGLTRKERLGFLGLNGSATYCCDFDKVRVPKQWVISEHADTFVEQVRAWFVLYQVPLALGVMEATTDAMRSVSEKQGGCNRYLPVQPEHIAAEADDIKNRTYRLAAASDIGARWREVLGVRLQSAYAVLQAVQAGMLFHGSAGYVLASSSSRRLREAYFFSNLTPTVRHLEKLNRNE